MPTVAVGFQEILAMLTMLDRLPNGRYPARNPADASWLLPLTEYTRQAILTGAASMDVEVIATNSSGDPARRATLVQRLGPGAVERVIDPGIEVVTRNLAGADGVLSDDCRLCHTPLVLSEGIMDTIYIPLEFRQDESRESPGLIAGILMTYGEPANDRPEMFDPGAFYWRDNGITIRAQHDRNAGIVRAIPYLEGRELRINAPLPNTTAGRDAAMNLQGDNPLWTGLSVEFRAERETRRGGRRVITRAFLDGAGLVDKASYSGSTVEVREDRGQRRKWWL